MAKKVKEPCKCIERVNEKLAERGCAVTRKLEITLATGDLSLSAPLVQLHKTTVSRKPLPAVACAYCPFCGRKY